MATFLCVDLFVKAGARLFKDGLFGQEYCYAAQIMLSLGVFCQLVGAERVSTGAYQDWPVKDISSDRPPLSPL